MAYYKAIRIEFVSEEALPLPSIVSGGSWVRAKEGFVLSGGMWKKILGVFVLKNGAWAPLKE